MPQTLRARYLASCLLLGACADLEAPADYRPLADSVGYASEALDPLTYRVSFSGNRHTPRDLVERYALLRAAEVTLAAGHSNFALIDKVVEERRRIQAFATGTPLSPLRSRRAKGQGGAQAAELRLRDPFPVFKYQQITAFTAKATVRLFSAEPPAESYRRFDAAALVRESRPAAD